MMMMMMMVITLNVECTNLFTEPYTAAGRAQRVDRDCSRNHAQESKIFILYVTYFNKWL